MFLKELYFRVPGCRVLESRMKGTDANTNSSPDSQKDSQKTDGRSFRSENSSSYPMPKYMAIPYPQLWSVQCPPVVPNLSQTTRVFYDPTALRGA